EIVEYAGAHGTRLVVDRALGRGEDRRLVAHIAADEPAGNAELACRLYLESGPADGPRCRALTEEDLIAAPFASSTERSTAPPAHGQLTQPRLVVPRTDRSYRLERVAGRLRIPELRWRRSGPAAAVVSLRDIVGDLQDYEPA